MSQTMNEAVATRRLFELPGDVVFEAYWDNRRGTGGWHIPLVTATQMRGFIRAFNAGNPETPLRFDARTGTLSGPAEAWGVEDDDGEPVEGDHHIQLFTDFLRTPRGQPITVYELDFGWVFDLHTPRAT